ncbi:flagellar transcriptional regulator FlhD [Enterobacter chuandaensis]|uniref:flagellar transcriptional regulator FlhD n=1 Tax=Enterobacter chuandaensis TaxID=2497875 RepID=UPI00300C1451
MLDKKSVIQNIFNVNLSYLLLIQQLIKDDKVTACFRSGLSIELIELLSVLPLPQIIKLSSSSQLICKLRINDRDILDSLTKESRINGLQQLQTGILLSSENLNPKDSELQMS